MSVRACPKCDRNSFEQRRDNSWWCLYASCGYDEPAIDALQALRTENARLREALKKIADLAPGYGDVCELIARIARAALQPSEGGPGA